MHDNQMLRMQEMIRGTHRSLRICVSFISSRLQSVARKLFAGRVQWPTTCLKDIHAAVLAGSQQPGAPTHQSKAHTA